MKDVVVSGRALALVVLAYSLLRVLVLRAFGAKTGLKLFRENYDADRLPPVSAAERSAMESFSGCIGCGRCDLGEGRRIATSKGEYPGLMGIVLGASRSMPDFDAASKALAHVPTSVLAEKNRICPTGVPFVALADFVHRKAKEART